MAQNGPDIADDLKSTFGKALGAPFRAATQAYDTVKNALGMEPKPDTTWHDNMVKTANEGFAKQAAANATKKQPIPAPKTPTPKKPGYKKGTDYVPKTGDAKLHKGEAVLNKDDADKYREAKMGSNSVMEELKHSLSSKEEKPKKEIAHIKTKKAKSGGYIHTHVHTHPEHHPDEEHISPDQDSMVQHMMEHMGAPNPGEAEADAGQSGIPSGAPEPGEIPGT